MTIEQFGIIFGIIATTATGAVFIIKEFKKLQSKYRNKLNRNWTNEGDVTSVNKETHFIELRLNVDLEDGEVWGRYSSNAKGNSELAEFSINGKIFYKTVSIQITKMSRNNLILMGVAKLKLKSNGKRLQWLLKKGDIEYFPKNTLMWENPFDIIFKEQKLQ